MKIVVVGAVAGGATAARACAFGRGRTNTFIGARRACIFFANCGLPYYIGGVITRREALFVSPLETIRAKYGFDIRTRSEVLSIDRERKVVLVRILTQVKVRTLR